MHIYLCISCILIKIMYGVFGVRMAKTQPFQKMFFFITKFPTFFKI